MKANTKLIKDAAKKVVKKINKSIKKKHEFIFIKRNNLKRNIPIFIVDNIMGAVETIWDDFEIFEIGKYEEDEMVSYLSAMMIMHYTYCDYRDNGIYVPSMTPRINIIVLDSKEDMQFSFHPEDVIKIKTDLLKNNIIAHNEYFLNKTETSVVHDEFNRLFDIINKNS